MMVRAIALVLLAAISQPTADWDQWREHRRARLLSEDGWLTLVGLYWLKPGENRFGSDPGNPVILPKGKSPAVAGTLTREGDAVTLKVEPGVDLTADVGVPRSRGSASPGLLRSVSESCQKRSCYDLLSGSKRSIGNGFGRLTLDGKDGS